VVSHQFPLPSACQLRSATVSSYFVILSEVRRQPNVVEGPRVCWRRPRRVPLFHHPCQSAANAPCISGSGSIAITSRLTSSHNPFHHYRRKPREHPCMHQSDQSLRPFRAFLRDTC
jgi:hypothetical protein